MEQQQLTLTALIDEKRVVDPPEKRVKANTSRIPKRAESKAPAKEPQRRAAKEPSVDEPEGRPPKRSSGSEPEKSEDTSPKVFSISELNALVADKIESEFATVWVQGEISNFVAHRSGHFYLSLKDRKSQIRAVMFKGFNSKLKFRPENGMEVLVRGKLTVYQPRGDYQLFCEKMEPVGQGALQLAFEQLKAKLQSEGLFDGAKKRSLPMLPEKIGVITSPTGAAIRDILNVLRRRYKGLDITIVPVQVQGATAAASVVKGIELANRVGSFDVLIVGRGGGSIEDLWCFNEEVVARALAASKIPTISAVGHEIDFTIADFVADLRAPTPSAAAELVVKSSAELDERVQSHLLRLKVAMANSLKAYRKDLVSVAKRLVDPQKRVRELIQRLDESAHRLQLAMQHLIREKRVEIDLLTNRFQGALRVIERKREAWRRLSMLLDSVSPLKVLERGYSIVTQKERVVKSSEELSLGSKIDIRMHLGSLEAEVVKVRKGKV
jgi:exodeoxyribonuclease VII large subunit